MISVPPNVQYQLGDAIGVIADSDFWEKWDTLVDVRVIFNSMIYMALVKPCVGFGLPSDTRHSANQQWCASSGAFYFQEMASSLSVRPVVH